MRCPSCKSTLRSEDLATDTATGKYKCVRCGARWIPKYDWKVLIVLVLVVAPILDFILQFVFTVLAKSMFGESAPNEAIVASAVVSTIAVLFVAYRYLRNAATFE
jgi:hypothetical protein